MLELQQSTLRRRIEAAIEADPLWVMPEDIRAEMSEITAYLSKASHGALQIAEARKKERESVPTDVLEAQFREELVRAAELFSEEQWQQLDEVRARLAKEEALRELHESSTEERP